jgi:hypothetical protein
MRSLLPQTDAIIICPENSYFALAGQPKCCDITQREKVVARNLVRGCHIVCRYQARDETQKAREAEPGKRVLLMGRRLGCWGFAKFEP